MHDAWPKPTPTVRPPAYTGSVGLRLVDNLGRMVWQQLLQNGGALERTLWPCPFAPGLYNLVHSPGSGTSATRHIVLNWGGLPRRLPPKWAGEQPPAHFAFFSFYLSIDYDYTS